MRAARCRAAREITVRCVLVGLGEMEGAGCAPLDGRETEVGWVDTARIGVDRVRATAGDGEVVLPNGAGCPTTLLALVEVASLGEVGDTRGVLEPDPIRDPGAATIEREDVCPRPETDRRAAERRHTARAGRAGRASRSGRPGRPGGPGLVPVERVFVRAALLAQVRVADAQLPPV